MKRPLKNIYDLYSLFYLSLASLTFFTHWQLEETTWLLTLASSFFCYGVGCVLHCHAHQPMWNYTTLNRMTEVWIILLRGDGVYSWIPTHILNHHRHSNHQGDVTLTYRFSNQFDLFNFLRYLLHGSYSYIRLTLEYIFQKMSSHPRQGLFICFQIILYFSFIGILLFIDFHRTLWVFLIPQAAGFFGMIGTGFMQHHYTHEDSLHHHSRNFVGTLNNLMHFNHGYHGIHHEDISLHWSEWPQAHQKKQHLIHPELNQKSLPWFLIKTFFLKYFFGTLQPTDFRTKPHKFNQFEKL